MNTRSLFFSVLFLANTVFTGCVKYECSCLCFGSPPENVDVDICGPSKSGPFISFLADTKVKCPPGKTLESCGCEETEDECEDGPAPTRFPMPVPEPADSPVNR